MMITVKNLCSSSLKVEFSQPRLILQLKTNFARATRIVTSFHLKIHDYLCLTFQIYQNYVTIV